MDTALFVFSKLVGALIRPETWLVLGIAGGLVALLLGRLRLARRVLAATLVATLLVAVFPLGEVLVRPLESRFPANPTLTKVDGIVALGGAEDSQLSEIWGQPQLLEGAERFTAALELARRFPKARVVFAGGSDRLRNQAGNYATESDVAEAFFLAQGLDASRLQVEGRSRNTTENARYSLPLAQPRDGETWVLVTSAFHMPRALNTFSEAGWPPLLPYPVDYRSGRFVDGIGWDLAQNLHLLNVALKEYVGLLVHGAQWE